LIDWGLKLDFKELLKLDERFEGKLESFDGKLRVIS
jgi:hypothetical protein